MLKSKREKFTILFIFYILVANISDEIKKLSKIQKGNKKFELIIAIFEV